jgi:hypothetical protein
MLQAPAKEFISAKTILVALSLAIAFCVIVRGIMP